MLQTFKTSGTARFAGNAATAWTEPPFLPLTASPLVILATARLAYALITLAGLAWLFIITTLICHALAKVLPRFGRGVILIFLSTLIASLYYLFLYFFNPVLATECFLFIAITPIVYCAASFVPLAATRDNDGAQQHAEALRAPAKLQASLFIMMIGIALIREPLGYASLSLPGGKDGIIELFNREGAFRYQIQCIASPTGALLVLGYILALFRHINRAHDSGMHTQEAEHGN